jgi:DhnA family fructose-bisphosphate aldolase class Ia
MDYVDGKWIGKNTADELVKLVGVIGGLGDSSRNTWMKLPYCEEFHRVTMATTCPILMLGGPSKEDPRQTFIDFAAGMATRANVRGALVGRNISFPGPEDPAAVAQAIHEIVHQGISADQAVERTVSQRDKQLDSLFKYIKD